MKTEKPKVALYGLHYYANNQLIPNASDRLLFQCLIDMVRRQLSLSLENQTVQISKRRLGLVAGLNIQRTVPQSLLRLEASGLIKMVKDGVKVCCDDYVAIVQHYVSLEGSERDEFASLFVKEGVGVLQKCNIKVEPNCREELLGMSGGSICCNSATSSWECCTSATSGSQEYCNSATSDSRECCRSATLGVKEYCNSATLSDSEGENVAEVQHSFSQPDSGSIAFMQHFVEELAGMLHKCNTAGAEIEGWEGENVAEVQHCQDEEVKNALQDAFRSGIAPKSLKNDPKKCCTYATLSIALLQHWTLKSVALLHNSNNIDMNKKKNERGDGLFLEGQERVKKGLEREGEEKAEKETELSEDEEYERDQETRKKWFENLYHIDPIELTGPFGGVGKVKEGSESLGEDSEEGENSQEDLKTKRPERRVIGGNPYKNKPFLKLKDVEEMIDYLPEVIKSPVNYFIYHFCWGLFDLYCDHYHCSYYTDEEGELVETEPDKADCSEMVHAALPQDEVLHLADNVYQDMLGAVEQGYCVFGDNDEWKSKFGFKTFKEFDPFKIFEWKKCTMKDKSIPAFEVVLDKFYDVEAEDVYVPSRLNSKEEIAQNRRFTIDLMEAEVEGLTPMEKAIKRFYEDFVVAAEEYILDDYKDGRGTRLESGGPLPDHLFRHWCYPTVGIPYDEFTKMFASKYNPSTGVRKRSYPFSAGAVVEWNERNYYQDTLAHRAIKTASVEEDEEDDGSYD